MSENNTNSVKTPIGKPVDGTGVSSAVKNQRKAAEGGKTDKNQPQNTKNGGDQQTDLGSSVGGKAGNQESDLKIMEVQQDDEPSPRTQNDTNHDMHIAITKQSHEGALLGRVGSLSKLNKSPSKSLNVIRVRQPDGVTTFRDKRQPLQQYEANLIIKNH